MEQFAPGTAAYNIPVARRLRGPLDRPALQRALDAVLARHETLRSRYPSTDDGRPVLEIAEPGPFALRTADAAGVEEAGRLVDELAAEPFDLVTGPLVNAALIRLADDDHVLLLVVHHSVSDGWSSEVLVSEMLRGYAAYASGRPDPLPELPVQYGDFAVWQRERLTGARLAGRSRTGRRSSPASSRWSCPAPAPAPSGRPSTEPATASTSTVGCWTGSPGSAGPTAPPRTWCCSPPTSWCSPGSAGSGTSRSARRSPAVRSRNSKAWWGCSSTSWPSVPGWTAIPPSPSSSPGPGKPVWRPTHTRNCLSPSWCRSSRWNGTCRAPRCSRRCSPSRTTRCAATGPTSRPAWTWRRSGCAPRAPGSTSSSS